MELGIRLEPRVDWQQLNILMQNVNNQLTLATNRVGRMWEDAIRRAGIEATRHKPVSYTHLRINRALDEKRRWEELAVRISPVYSDMPRGGGNGDKLTEAVQRIVDLEAEIDRDIDRLVDLRQWIERNIDAVEDTRLRDILRRRYVDGDRIEKIAVDMMLDYRWVRRLFTL